MKKAVKKAILRIKSSIGTKLRVAGKVALRPVLKKFDQQEALIRLVAKDNIKTRFMAKKAQGLPINVLFVCHEPALWSMFESVYQAMAEDTGFSPKIIALPYAHGTLPAGEYKDGGMVEFLEERGIPVVRGYEKETAKWMRPDEFSPDYMFFQTPYSFFPPEWCIEQVSLIARVCYIPYATSLISSLELGVQPGGFLRHASLLFKESDLAVAQLKRLYQNEPWFELKKVAVSGNPKLDELKIAAENFKKQRSERKEQTKTTRLVWTPRWNTGEGVCHFFDYKDFFSKYCNAHPEVYFTFRPHPLCFQNFIKSGEMNLQQITRMQEDYNQSPNMTIDKVADFKDSVLSSDILISDLSSMIYDCFIIGNPIIYTHRTAQFTEVGAELFKGVYWVRNESELASTIDMLIRGEDPLRPKRESIIKTILYVPVGGSGVYIKQKLWQDFQF